MSKVSPYLGRPRDTVVFEPRGVEEAWFFVDVLSADARWCSRIAPFPPSTSLLYTERIWREDIGCVVTRLRGVVGAPACVVP